MLANKSRLFRSIIDGLSSPRAGSLNSKVDVGPRTTPSALRAFSTISGWMVLPSSRRPAWPTGASSIRSPSAKRSEATRNTESVVAVISGPIPSPARTRRFISADSNVDAAAPSSPIPAERKAASPATYAALLQGNSRTFFPIEEPLEVKAGELVFRIAPDMRCKCRHRGGVVRLQLGKSFQIALRRRAPEFFSPQGFECPHRFGLAPQQEIADWASAKVIYFLRQN